MSIPSCLRGGSRSGVFDAADAREAIEQPDFAAVFRCDIGAVHAVDDAREHETGLAGIKQRAIEQLPVERWTDADALARSLRMRSAM